MALRLLPFLILIAFGCERRSPPHDVESQVAAYGVDYPTALSSAYRSVPGLKGFFLLAGCTDAAGSEGYCSDLEKLLVFYGDARFSDAVASTTSNVCEKIVPFLAYVSAYGEHEGEWRKFRSTFPRTALLVSSR